MSIEKVRIPDIGDVSEVEVIELCVAEGDQIAVDDALLVIESDKASMEVPSTRAGKVLRLTVAVGDTCAEGDVIAEIEVDSEETDSETDSEADAEADAEAAGDETQAEAKSDDESAAGDADEDSEAPEDDVQEDDERSGSSPAAGATKEAETETVEVRVPDVGDADEVVVVEVMVAAGDEVEAEAGLVALESDKATMEVPAPKSGKVVSVEVKEGDTVGEGTLIARLEVAGARAAGSAGGKAKRSESADRKDKPEPAASGSSKPVAEPKPKPKPAPSREPEKGEAGEAADPAGAQVYAGPAVRRLARELGVKLAEVKGSGAKGRILKEDVHAFVKTRMQAPAAAATGAAIPAIPEVDFSRFGAIETRPLSRIMRAGASNLHRSWLNVPHVTQHDEADVTALEVLRKELKPEAERAGVKLTPLPFIMKAVQAALVQFPRFNGSFAGDGENYVFKQYFHIGFAVDTPEGLLVPVIRDVDRKGIYALSAEIADLSERARNLKLKPDEMRGGCMSISSLGNIGGTGFTPIVNAPEVAILGVSRLTRKPVWQDDAFVPRDMLPLSLSYDHRAINGAEAGRFMTWLCQALGDIRRLLL
ncbi:MAG: dihydrolipoyllysine-residue acetyltransferase [Gammaproteobacteria bacterium]|nr:dihydrolipoyllysine-residue acetyltransferase [Gammaproteobacteria bacterium]